MARSGRIAPPTEIDDRTNRAPAVDVSRLPWVNGPTRTLATWEGTTVGGPRRDDRPAHRLEVARTTLVGARW